MTGGDGMGVEHAWEPNTWYLIRDDRPYLDVLTRGYPAQPKGETKLEALDEPAPEGTRWQRWNLEADLAYERRLGEVVLALKVPKNLTLRCYVVPTLLLSYRDVIAMVEDIESELGVTAAWDMITERPERSWSRRIEGGHAMAPSELVGLIEEELPAALAIRRDPFRELGPQSRRGIPLGENAIVSHWAIRRHGQLRQASELVATELGALRLKGARINPEGRQKRINEEIARLAALEQTLGELGGSLARLGDEVELMTAVHPAPLFQRDHRLRRLLRAFAPRVSEALSAVESSRSHFPPMFLNSLWELWGAVWLARELRGLGFAGPCSLDAADMVSSCSWRLERAGVVVELDYEPDPVLIDYEQLPPAHDRDVPALEWAALHQDLDIERPLLGTEPRCSPDYVLRITTPSQLKSLVVGDACLASPDHHGTGPDKSGAKPYIVERYRRTLGWAVKGQVVRCHPMGGFVVFPPPGAAWRHLEQVPGAGDCTLLCPSPQHVADASRRLINLLRMVAPEIGWQP
ncbi:hypothetical protein [Bradyrhizobium sp. CCBAU 51753]|uniref:hypothetical protein n=1 Tax=Bradyrhizobium sp. CCBAU 51753 TaxID=1325100 RepID=UPI00188AB0DC|nr:hypothetical protein [Bradyrhizobium sp. CCBAU 51753]QOZ24012.1 hypothetical protein XH93_10765 [Bradyrhizobium sp. CCBAU 51753]